MAGDFLERKEYLLEKMSGFGNLISDEKINQLLLFYDILLEWNSFMNLTAITDFKETAVKHFLDSLMILKYTSIEEGALILDFGSGAGFPGIPLKIVRPDLRITLLDSLNKRVKFLNEVINKTGLKDVSAVHGRGEELGRNALFREKYDFVLSRAVANLSTLSEYCLPFVKKDGWFISYKSKGVKEETEKAGTAVKILGGKLFNVDCFLLDDDMERSFVRIKKVKATPNKYPRGGGKPSKEPL